MTQLAFSESRNVTSLAISSGCEIHCPDVILEVIALSSWARPLCLGQWIDEHLFIVVWNGDWEGGGEQNVSQGEERRAGFSGRGWKRDVERTRQGDRQNHL